MFWDTSAIVPLLVEEQYSKKMVALYKAQPGKVVWWGALVECHSAICRLGREKKLAAEDRTLSVNLLNDLKQTWAVILPDMILRDEAVALLHRHTSKALRAADALQLAAALVWANHNTSGKTLISLDERLREIAESEGFKIAPQ
jgi:predicted nucleic acid-binding protein